MPLLPLASHAHLVSLADSSGLSPTGSRPPTLTSGSTARVVFAHSVCFASGLSQTPFQAWGIQKGLGQTGSLISCSCHVSGGDR